MILIWILIIPLIAGLVAWPLACRSRQAARWLSLAAMLITALLTCVVWFQTMTPQNATSPAGWAAELNWNWIPSLGIRFHLAVDGLSVLLILLTALLGMLSVAASWTEIRERAGLFHFTLLWTLAAVTGLFMAADLFLFYFFWEMMLIPTYLLIQIWGHENRTRAALKFFIFTQAGGLLLLISILTLVFAHYHQTDVLTFNPRDLVGTLGPGPFQMLVMLGFFAAFAVKLPIFPLHTWLPDAHTQAPTAGSVVLAGLLLKTGPYGMLRFSLSLFPESSHAFAPVAMVLALIGILYGAYMAYAQTDIKRLIAYTSVSHMGFVLLGIYAWNEVGHQGAIVTMLCHGLSTGGLFIMAGVLMERLHTRDLAEMGGFWSQAPRLGAVGMILAMASLGLPGLGNFVGELLVLLGAYQRHVVWGAVGSAGLVFAAIYSLSIIQRTFHGKPREGVTLADIGAREVVMFAVMILALLWIGLYPQTVLDTFASFESSVGQVLAGTHCAWSHL